MNTWGTSWGAGWAGTWGAAGATAQPAAYEGAWTLLSPEPPKPRRRRKPELPPWPQDWPPPERPARVVEAAMPVAAPRRELPAAPAEVEIREAVNGGGLECVVSRETAAVDPVALVLLLAA